MADAVDLKSNVERREGSNPSAGTFYILEIMMNAKSCDRCGKFYHPYKIEELQKKRVKTKYPIGVVSSIDTEEVRIQGVIFKPSYCDTECDFDLCPDCLHELIEWMGCDETDGH